MTARGFLSKINFKIIPKKPLRLLALFAVLSVIYGWDCWHRRWSPSITQETEHYIVYSTASPEQTQKIGDVVETLYGAYHDFFGDAFGANVGDAKLKLKLFGDRDKFRRCNRVRGWAEALYRKPYCYAYYSATELNPYHWMLHESVHQLNREISQLKPPKWIDEGIAEFFGTSGIVGNLMRPGIIDRHTYPIWHLDSMSLSGDLAQDKSAGQIIPLKVILTGKGGPKMKEYFNLYYTLKGSKSPRIKP